MISTALRPAQSQPGIFSIAALPPFQAEHWRRHNRKRAPCGRAQPADRRRTHAVSPARRQHRRDCGQDRLNGLIAPRGQRLGSVGILRNDRACGSAAQPVARARYRRCFALSFALRLLALDQLRRTGTAAILPVNPQQRKCATTGRHSRSVPSTDHWGNTWRSGVRLRSRSSCSETGSPAK
jgi:hypothetical protein